MVEDSEIRKSKEKNFSGCFQVSEDELRELLKGLEETKNEELPLMFC